MKNCLNCNHTLSSSVAFCPNCGQKTKLSKLNFWNLISDFFATFFNLEAKIWKTLLHIWIPAKLTSAFIAGKRKSYYNPLRIFIVVLFAFFTLMIFKINNTLKEADEFAENSKHNVWKQELILHYDSIAPQAENKEDAAAFKMHLFHIYTDTTDYKAIEELDRASQDTLENLIKKDSIKSAKQIAFLIDSLLTKQNLEEIVEDTAATEPFNITFNTDDEGKLDDDNHNVQDFYRLSETELHEKHEATTKWHKLLISQMRKMLLNLSASIKFILGNGTWAITAIILLMALVFKLLYIRHSIPYAEHFVFHIYGHTRVLFLAIVSSLLLQFTEYDGLWIVLSFFTGLLYLFVGMLLYYKQGFFKTTLKFIVALSAYTVLMLICGSLIFSISLLVF